MDQVPLLLGQLPLPDATLMLPCVQIDSGLWADIHIIRHGRRHWVLFLIRQWWRP
ncbi:MAG: hypothetical protein MUD15_05965 [Desulfobacterota bacterium]|nr:hypothetical protein [Thermodesulfobacteriota bacterium]